MRLRSPLSSVPAVRANGQATDTDFELDSWLRDLGDDRGWEQPGIGTIRVDRSLERARRVVGMVTLCTPNGFGDLILNLKDPSGTIGASVHKKVLSDENLSKSLSVGSVIFLKQVAVLRPSNTVCYLNVTQTNVEKVLQKDSVSSCKQVVPSGNSEMRSQQPGQGDNMEREAGAETSDGMIAKQEESLLKSGISSEARSSTDDIMRKLIGCETMMPSSKGITVAKGLDAVARCGSEKPDIGLQMMVEGHTREHASSSNRVECQQLNLSTNTRCSQPIVGESSVMSPSRDCTQGSCTGNARPLFDDDWMQPSRKNQKSHAILPDGNGARMNSNINTSSMDKHLNYGLESSVNIVLDDIAEGFHGANKSIRKFEHQQKDLHAASGTLHPTQENCSISATSGTLLSNYKVVPVAPVAGWTDEQLSELFVDY